MHTSPFLFELLNDMDGLADDCDVIFVLTTNRADALEPALASRLGRIDLAVELPMPDADGRRQLLELYGQGLDLSTIDLSAIAAEIEGASPAYIKELLRKAAVDALAAGQGLKVGEAELDAAMRELAEGGQLGERSIGFRRPGADAERVEEGASRATGFPRRQDIVDRVITMHFESSP
jgi:ATP-dependent 26S proteasome regulatory subunit